MVWILYGHHPWPDRWLFAMLKRQQCYGTPRLRGGWVGGGGLVGNTKSSKISHIRTWNWGGVEQDGITANFSRWIGNLFTLLIFPSAYMDPYMDFWRWRCWWVAVFMETGFCSWSTPLSPFLRKTCLEVEAVDGNDNPCQWVGGYLGVSSLSWWFREWGRERERKEKKGPTLHLNSGLLGRACMAPFELYITGLTSPTSNCQDDQFAPFGQPISGQATVLSDAAIQRPAMCQQSTTPAPPSASHVNICRLTGNGAAGSLFHFSMLLN